MLKPNDLVKYKHIEGNQKNTYLVGETKGVFIIIRKVRQNGQDNKQFSPLNWTQALASNFIKVGER